MRCIPGRSRAVIEEVSQTEFFHCSNILDTEIACIYLHSVQKAGKIRRM
jgi:hypothetical protein